MIAHLESRRARDLRLSLVVLCSVLFAAWSALWLHGLGAEDKLRFGCLGYLCEIGSFPHHLYFTMSPHSYAWKMPSSWDVNQHPIPPRWKYLEPGFRISRSFTSIWLPHWLVMLFLGTLPGHRVFSMLRRRTQLQQGLCPACGYDLRATPDRCPECGSVFTPPIRVETNPPTAR